MILLFVILSIAFCVGAMRLPKWFFSSFTRSRLWQFRDETCDLILAGELPRETQTLKFLELCDSAARRKPVSLTGYRDHETLLPLAGRLERLIARDRTCRSWVGLIRVMSVLPAARFSFTGALDLVR